MLEREEEERLQRLYEQLRIKLLDLTKKNRMLNYALAPRSRRQLQIVDVTLEQVYAKLVEDDASLRVAYLAEPEGIPPEEKTVEFLDAYEHAKVSDVEYLIALEALIAAAGDDEIAIERLERELRDRLRQNLGLPPRPKRADVNRRERARSLGINPNPELQATNSKKPYSEALLQTLKYPDELDGILEKISDETRLAEQEAGLSTLFLAFGFLEWYESDASDKPIYAPLLMLPVKAEREKVKGKDVYRIAVREGGGESNVSLQKILETKFGRTLPDFSPGDTEDVGSVEGYLTKVRASIDGLKRWQVRRWLVLGHFAFSRIAIYEDTKPERWSMHPAKDPLVGSLLNGFEEGAGGITPSFHAPEDYRIDDPEIEKVAPILIQDADASQHSALVDVMNSKNLVIQGPPGTGKSQTITNIIANALAAGKTVLFLAEKQAALDVVKRRLDTAGLGEFCLELHSDKASPKAVIQSLARRHQISINIPLTAPDAGVDATWIFTRSQISEYLEALHKEAEDGATPFNLIWGSIRGASLNSDVHGIIRSGAIPTALLSDPSKLRNVRGKLEIFAATAQLFADTYGLPSLSPWSITPPHNLPAHDREQMLNAISELRRATAEFTAFIDRQDAVGITSATDAGAALFADTKLPDFVDASIIASIATIDLDGLERALTLQSKYLAAAAELATLPTLDNVDSSVLARAEIFSTLAGGEFALLKPSDFYAKADQAIVQNRALLNAIRSMRSALEMLGFSGSNPDQIVEAVAMAVVMVEKIRFEHRPWVGASQINAKDFEKLHARWVALLKEENELRETLPHFEEERWPAVERLDTVVETLRRTGFGKLLGRLRGDGSTARETLEHLRLSASPQVAANLLARIAKHARAIESFNCDREAATILGAAWTGMSTPFGDIDAGIKLRWFIQDKLRVLPGGDKVAAAVIALPPDDLSALADYSGVANAYRSALNSFRALVDGRTLDAAVARCQEKIAYFEKLLRIDPDRVLSSLDLSVSRLAEIAIARTHVARQQSIVGNSPFSIAIRALASESDGAAKTSEAIAWVRAVLSMQLPSLLQDGLLSQAASDWRVRLREIAKGYSAVHDAYRNATEALVPFGLKALDVFDLRSLVIHLDILLARRDELSEFIALRTSREELDKVGLADILRKADAAQLSPNRLTDVFDATVSRLRADAARRSSTPLTHRTGNDLEAKRKTFAERDRQKIIVDRATVRAQLLKRRPPAGFRHGPVKTWTQMSLLANEFPKQRRFTPVRGLLGRASNAIKELKPCFMMSPLSLAKFLPPEAVEFDVLVIDEASQMRPEDALGAMLRSKQIVVVGDPKQLPPTNFFDRTDDNAALDEEDSDDIDDESILERCQKVFGSVRRLKWHYRSRCESLIRFSNDSFYEGSLITFPAAKPGSFSIDLLRVDGVYQKKARLNVAEAERVAEEAIELMRHFAASDDESIPTLGIVAINMNQRDLIQETLRRLSAGDELVEVYMEKVEKKGEPLFVKNLENVQGDERDFIFISMTYGKEAGASVMRQHFGPINSKQGPRRLNVLFSRSRIRIGLFTSFGSADIKLPEKPGGGAEILKRYLEYAEVKGRAPVLKVDGEADSDFEIEVTERLRQRGYTVDLQVGVSGFKIDLGIRHPDHPEMFLAGIECDGAQYHSSKSARDRDRLREEVLRGLGWEILRVWSTDWFDNPDAQTDKLVKRLDELQAKPISAYRDYSLKEAYVPPDAAETVNDGDEAAADDTEFDVSVPQPASGDMVPVALRDEEEGVILLDGDGQLAESQAYKALVALRETVIRPTTSNWEPHRSILRDGMIETFVHQRISDTDSWFNRVPRYQRSGTDPLEKRLYFDRICAVIERITAKPRPHSPSTQDFILAMPPDSEAMSKQTNLPLRGFSTESA